MATSLEHFHGGFAPKVLLATDCPAAVIYDPKVRPKEYAQLTIRIALRMAQEQMSNHHFDSFAECTIMYRF